MTASPLFRPQNISPSQQQLDIQTSRHLSIIVDANAGAAKTTSLALKVAEMLALQRQKTGLHSPKKNPGTDLHRRRGAGIPAGAGKGGRCHRTHPGTLGQYL